MARIEANAVSAAEAEAHLRGVQNAQSLLNIALGESIERFQAESSHDPSNQN